MQRNERKILTVSEYCLVFGSELSGFKLYCRLLVVIIGKIASETKKEDEEEEVEEGSSGLKLYLLLLHSFQAAWTGSPMLPQPCIDHCKLSSSQSCDSSVVTNHSGTFRKLSSTIIQQPLTFKSNKTFPFSGHQLTLCPHQFSMFYVDFRKMYLFHPFP